MQRKSVSLLFAAWMVFGISQVGFGQPNPLPFEGKFYSGTIDAPNRYDISEAGDGSILMDISNDESTLFVKYHFLNITQVFTNNKVALATDNTGDGIWANSADRVSTYFGLGNTWTNAITTYSGDCSNLISNGFVTSGNHSAVSGFDQGGKLWVQMNFRITPRSNQPVPFPRRILPHGNLLTGANAFNFQFPAAAQFCDPTSWPELVLATVSGIGPVFYYAHQIFEIGSEARGDGDGRPESGERLELAVKLINMGDQNAQLTTATLQVLSSPYVTIVDSSNFWEDIAGGEIKDNLGGFVFDIDPNLRFNSVVTFRLNVAAVGGLWTSQFSLLIYVQDQVQINAPSNLAAQLQNNNTSVNLTWQDNSNNEDGFKIERKLGAAGSYAEIANVGANVTSYTNVGLTSGTYFYRVRAFVGSIHSSYSNEVSVTLPVTSQVGPLVHSSHFIDDIPGGTSPNGDGDGRAECGEHVGLAVTLLNQGNQTAVGVASTTLTCSDPDVTIIDSNNCWPDIPGGQTRENACGYEFRVNRNLAQKKTVNFTMTVTAQNGGPWTSTFTVQLFGPDPTVGPAVHASHSINDDNISESRGDGDGRAEGGERIELAVALRNQGSNTAIGVTAVLSTRDSDVTIVDNENFWPDTPSGATRDNLGQFVFDVNPNLSQQKSVTFFLTANANTCTSWTSSFSLTIFPSPPPRLADLVADRIYLRSGPSLTDPEVNQPVVGQQHFVFFEWRNIGSSAANNFRVEIRFNGNVLCASTNQSAPANSNFVTRCTNEPVTWPAGTNTIEGRLDVNNVISESNENNNILSRTFTMPSGEIRPVAPASAKIGAEFIVEVPANNVQNLFGISFVLNYTNTIYVDVRGTPTAGEFMGNDPVFLPTVDDAAGKISIGVSHKAGQPPSSGSGIVARIRFISLATTPPGTQVLFTLSNIVANDPNGVAIALTPFNHTVTLISPGASSVWPGDANIDGVVNQADVLPLGLHWNRTGPPRQNASTTWSGQAATPWSPEAATHADANGDGVVNQADVLPVGLNWGRTHTSQHAIVPGNGDPIALNKTNAAGIRLSINGDTDPDREFLIDVAIDQVTGLFGVSFEMLYSPATLADPQSAEAGSFIGNDVIFFPNFDKPAGKIGIGVTRKTGQNGVNGTGVVARIRMRVSSQAVRGQVMTFMLQNITANDSLGQAIPLNLAAANTPVVVSVASRSHGTLPTAFALHANTPNPFNPETEISYDLPEHGDVRVDIYDMLGQHVRTLVQERQPAGRYFVTWDGRNEHGQPVASGVFIYQLRVDDSAKGGAGKFVQSRRMLLLR